MLSRYLTARQLAQTLSVHENTLAKWRLSGVGPKYHKIHRRIRYAERDIEDWLRVRVFQSTTDAGTSLFR